MKEHILIDTEMIGVEAFSINKSGLWQLIEYSNMDETLLIPSIQMHLPLQSIYEGIKLL